MCLLLIMVIHKLHIFLLIWTLMHIYVYVFSYLCVLLLLFSYLVTPIFYTFLPKLSFINKYFF